MNDISDCARLRNLLLRFQLPYEESITLLCDTRMMLTVGPPPQTTKLRSCSRSSGEVVGNAAISKLSDQSK